MRHRPARRRQDPCRHPGPCKNRRLAQRWPQLSLRLPLLPSWLHLRQRRIMCGRLATTTGTASLGFGLQGFGLRRLIVERCGLEDIGTIAEGARFGCADIGVEA